MSIWTEKYRPKKVDEIVGNDDAKEIIKAFLNSPELFPQLLIFVGEPGTGKTSMATAIAHELYGEDGLYNFKEYNASDDRGIDFIRNKIKEMASAGVYGDVPFRLIFLDEADYLTPEAQATMRRMVEKFSNNAKFIFSINYPNRIIKPLFSRGLKVKFGKPSMKELVEFLNKIASEEGFSIDEDAAKEIIHDTNYIPRNALIKLQSAYVLMKNKGHDTITLEHVRSTTYPEIGRASMKPIIAGIKSRDIGAALSATLSLIESGLNPTSVLAELSERIMDSQNFSNKPELYQVIADIDRALTEGATPMVQFAYLYAKVIEHYNR